MLRWHRTDSGSQCKSASVQGSGHSWGEKEGCRTAHTGGTLERGFSGGGGEVGSLFATSRRIVPCVRAWFHRSGGVVLRVPVGRADRAVCPSKSVLTFRRRTEGERDARPRTRRVHLVIEEEQTSVGGEEGLHHPFPQVPWDGETLNCVPPKLRASFVVGVLPSSLYIFLFLYIDI